MAVRLLLENYNVLRLLPAVKLDMVKNILPMVMEIPVYTDHFAPYKQLLVAYINT